MSNLTYDDLIESGLSERDRLLSELDKRDAEIENLKLSEELLCDNIDKKDKELQKIRELIKKAKPHVKKSLGLIFETDLKHKHMREAKKEYEQWLSDVDKVDL